MKKDNKFIVSKIIGYCIGLLLVILPFVYSVHAATNIQGPSSSDITAFNQILEPVMKIYNFVKYSASILAVLFLAFAAIQMFANNNPMEKDAAKTRMMYTVIGLVVIWIAPIAVNYLTSTA